MIVAAEPTDKTMADRFQEAVGTSILNDQGMQYAFSKPLGSVTSPNFSVSDMTFPEFLGFLHCTSV